MQNFPHWIPGDIGMTQGTFPGGSVVKTTPSNAGSTGSIPGQEAKIPHAL